MPSKTYVYATHDIPLECNVYSNGDEPKDNPVLLFFHAGGLVAGSRTRIPPWLVQVCIQRQWPLLSASYRLVPQVNGSGILQDAQAAYRFAESWSGKAGRQVIVAGASAGFFVAALVAHHVKPAPVALLSITGISTFRHPFFSSSKLIPPKPFVKEQMEKLLDRPVTVGFQPKSDATVFSPSMVTATGDKKPDYVRPKPASATNDEETMLRGSLYHYLLSENALPPLTETVDPGYTWATQDSGGEKLKTWPPTVFIHGDADEDVPLAVTEHAVECLGPQKAKLFIAKGQPHLFEATNFLEDEGDAMDTVRAAVQELDSIVADA